MQKDNLQQYLFIDCILVDFFLSPTVTDLIVITEAYYSEVLNSIRKKGLLKVTFEHLVEVNIRKTSEFDHDLSLPYDRKGDHVKANEMYVMDIFNSDGEDILSGKLDSDMLHVEVKFRSLQIEELGEIS
ncbi:hypothetical protein [Leptospira haakeii]|uniref:Uncharacterized protein n=1 Tax=Leptospira haakeii TaxID=2023198 RepID=A0ABX4PG02_9LEPT|nr:hypothetical protein [Leptospira haakeii]PKA14702.1 hypothetical protein CH363_17530 [Leptospira haakeii]PKA19081.1 hypothetical protein CH377_14785 [Leptospira haakeii]